jgi:hypothetical protein
MRAPVLLAALICCTAAVGKPALAGGMPPEIAAAVQKIGRLIDPPATGALFAPL